MKTRTTIAGVTLALTLAAPPHLLAQRERTLVGRDVEHGGFAAAVFKGSAVADQFAGFVGGRAAWVLNHVFALGAGGYWMAGGVDVPAASGGEDGLDMWYAGAELEFINDWSQVYHITFLTLVGGGAIEAGGESDGIWAVEPALNMEVNIAPWFRLYYGGGYRFVWGADLPGGDSGDLSQFFGHVGLKFGSF